MKQVRKCRKHVLLHLRKQKYGYRFSFGPWNIHEGADPFGPPVRPARDFESKLAVFREWGFDAVQFHDDDAVPGLDDLSPEQIRQHARAMRQKIADAGLIAEFVAPRLWEHPMTIDGAFTSNDAKARSYALDRAKKSIDISHELGTDLIVLWLAREGTYMREAKDSRRATEQLLEAINMILAYDAGIRIAIEPKPNEPMDMAYIPTIGHGLALGYQSSHPTRVGVLMESAHAVLAGLDPSDEIGFALSSGKLWSVHLNDQNGLKYDQDRSFGSVDLRRAFNQVRVLDSNQYWHIGLIGLDVKAIRTQPASLATKHLRNSLHTFLKLVEVTRSFDQQKMDALIAERDYEELDWLILNTLMGSQ
jgi:xylose isomerase